MLFFHIPLRNADAINAALKSLNNKRDLSLHRGLHIRPGEPGVLEKSLNLLAANL
jgi:hypothetical protein